MRFLLALAFLGSSAFAAEKYDIVIYGGTSGGVAAGIQAMRMGRSVVLIEPTKFVGGLTTGGLGATDIGNKQAIGGIAREFYHHIWEYYNDPKHWTRQTREDYFSKKQHGSNAGEKEDTMWTFEPHVATRVYQDMMREAKLKVIYGQRLDLKDGVKKDGTRITEIVMESGKQPSKSLGIKAEVAERKLPGTLYWVDLAPLPRHEHHPAAGPLCARCQLQDRRAALSCGHRRCDPGASRRTSRRGSCECAAAGGEPAGEAALNGSAKRGSLPLRTEGNLRRRVRLKRRAVAVRAAGPSSAAARGRGSRDQDPRPDGDRRRFLRRV